MQESSGFDDLCLLPEVLKNSAYSSTFTTYKSHSSGHLFQHTCKDLTNKECFFFFYFLCLILKRFSEKLTSCGSIPSWPRVGTSPQLSTEGVGPREIGIRVELLILHLASTDCKRKQASMCYDSSLVSFSFTQELSYYQPKQESHLTKLGVHIRQIKNIKWKIIFVVHCASPDKLKLSSISSPFQSLTHKSFNL